MPLFNKIPLAPAKAFRQYRGSFGNRPSGWVHFPKPLWAAWVHFCRSNQPTKGELLPSASVTKYFDRSHLSEIKCVQAIQWGAGHTLCISKPLWAAWAHFGRSNRPTKGELLPSASVTKHFDLFHLSEIKCVQAIQWGAGHTLCISKPLWAAWAHFGRSNRPTKGELLPSASVTKHFDLFHLSEIKCVQAIQWGAGHTLCISKPLWAAWAHFGRSNQPHRAVSIGIICFLRLMTLGRKIMLSLGSAEKARRMVSSLPM